MNKKLNLGALALATSMTLGGCTSSDHKTGATAINKVGFIASISKKEAQRVCDQPIKIEEYRTNSLGENEKYTDMNIQIKDLWNNMTGNKTHNLEQCISDVQKQNNSRLGSVQQILDFQKKTGLLGFPIDSGYNPNSMKPEILTTYLQDMSNKISDTKLLGFKTKMEEYGANVQILNNYQAAYMGDLKATATLMGIACVTGLICGNDAVLGPSGETPIGDSRIGQGAGGKEIKLVLGGN